MTCDYHSLRDTIIALTAEVLNRHLSPDAETACADFAALGVDSVNVFEIILKIETRYPVTLPDTFLFEHRTPDQAARALSALLSASLSCIP